MNAVFEIRIKDTGTYVFRADAYAVLCMLLLYHSYGDPGHLDINNLELLVDGKIQDPPPEVD